MAALVAGDAAAADTDSYSVVAGDTCRALSRRLFPDDPAGLDKLHALNPDLGPSPHHLKPGQKMTIPAPAPDAKIAFLHPLVKVLPREQHDWLEAATGRALWALDSVNTLAEAGAELRFRDETWLRMHENALIVVYGGGTERRGRQKGGGVQLVQGDLRLGLAALRGDPVSVAMPSARVDAMSRDLAVGVDEQKRSHVSVFDGFAKVSAAGKTIEVKTGFGTVVEPGQPPAPAQKLLVAPSWGDGSGATLVLAELGEGAEGQPAWEKREGAVRYRLELARDEKFSERVAERITTAPTANLRLAGLPLGSYFARVSAANAAGLWSPASAPRAVEVVRVAGLYGKRAPNANGYRATGSLSLNSDTPRLATYIDGKPAPMPADVEGVGTHEVRFTLSGEECEAVIVPVSIEAPRAKIAIKREGTERAAHVELFDAEGNPFEAEQGSLELRGKGGAKAVLLQRTGSGAYRASVPAGTATGAAFELVWQGTVLGEAAAQD